jgi:hypothetical protein
MTEAPETPQDRYGRAKRIAGAAASRQAVQARGFCSRAPVGEGGTLRRALTCHVLFLLTLLAFASGASGAPRVTLKATPVPIPGFPGTGDILGAGTEVEVQVTIEGTEYGGFPSPLTGMAFYSPAGFKVSSAGFLTCAASVLEDNGAGGCPKRSNAGPTGEGAGVVSFGGTRVDEKVTINELFAPADGLTFYVEGQTPASFQVLERAHWVSAGAAYGPELIVEVPLVETVPGGDDASILSFKVRVGAAYRRAKKTFSYLTLPRSCPAGGAPLKAEMKFMSGETVTVSYRQPCPKR